MSNLKLGVKLTRGQVGVPLSRLVDLIKRTQQFLTSASEDIGLAGDPGDWIADNFINGSVIFDCFRMDQQSPPVAERGYQILHNVMENNTLDSELNLYIRPVTRRHYAEISSTINEDEYVAFGLYRNGQASPPRAVQINQRDG